MKKCVVYLCLIILPGGVFAQETVVPEHIASGEQVNSYLKAAANAATLYMGKIEPGYTIRMSTGQACCRSKVFYIRTFGKDICGVAYFTVGE